ncbi:MAG: HipA domain-containing protein [Bacteroidia bacterium]|nr:HipA domain-containing protein [Bacteroidia bacterium]
MNRKCLYCYQKLEAESNSEFHEKCSMEFFGTTTAPALPYTIGQMSELAKSIVERSIAVPGVQPKLSLSLVKDTIGTKNKSRLTVVGALGGNFIFKPPSEHYPEMPQNEHVTMRIADAFEIRTVKSSLIRLQSGELSYVTKRIDRSDSGEKIHMLDMFQVLEAHDKYKSSLERVGKAIHQNSDNTLLDTVRFFELCVFCFLTGNNDMHLKNFSMILSGGHWLLAPAYDLLNVSVVNPEDTEELALTLEGKKRKLQGGHFERLGLLLGLNDKQVKNVFNRFRESRPLAQQWVENSFLSAGMKSNYNEVMNRRYNVLMQK